MALMSLCAGHVGFVVARTQTLYLEHLIIIGTITRDRRARIVPYSTSCEPVLTCLIIPASPVLA